MGQSKRTLSLAAGAAVIIGAALAARASKGPERIHIEPPSALTMPAATPTTAESLGHRDFRFLLAIVAGVSLGGAVAVSPVLLQGPYTNSQWLSNAEKFLVTTLAVALIYSAIAHGARFFLRRVEVVSIIGLILVFTCLGAAYMALSLPAPDSTQRWTIAFGLFCILSAIQIALVYRGVTYQQALRSNSRAQRTYARSLIVDGTLSTTSGVILLTLGYFNESIIAWPSYPYFAATLGLAVMIAAHLSQYRGRVRMRKTFGIDS